MQRSECGGRVRPEFPVLPDGGGRGQEPGRGLLHARLRAQLLRQHETGIYKIARESSRDEDPDPV